MNLQKILESDTLFELLEALEDFCPKALMRNNDDEIMELKDSIENTENDYLKILSSYLCVCDDADEVIEAVYEFIANCKGFAEADKENTQQISKDEFEGVLDECEQKCGIKSCIEMEHTVNAAEVDGVNDFEEFNIRKRENCFNIFLPRIDISADKREYIAGQLGLILYDVLRTKIPEDRIRHEICRYVPEKAGSPKSARWLFKELFYNVVQYEENKPRVYTELNLHLKRVIVLEFFRDMIVRYLRK